MYLKKYQLSMCYLKYIEKKHKMTNVPLLLRSFKNI